MNRSGVSAFALAVALTASGAGGAGAQMMFQPLGSYGDYLLIQQQVFAIIDADRDGSATRAEYDRYRNQTFGQMDKDNTGTVSLAEFMAWQEPRGGYTAAARAAREQRFKEINASGSGAITRAEWAADGERQFARLDRNRDGKITFNEMTSTAMAPAPRR